MNNIMHELQRRDSSLREINVSYLDHFWLLRRVSRGSFFIDVCHSVRNTIILSITHDNVKTDFFSFILTCNMLEKTELLVARLLDELNRVTMIVDEVHKKLKRRAFTCFQAKQFIDARVDKCQLRVSRWCDVLGLPYDPRGCFHPSCKTRRTHPLSVTLVLILRLRDDGSLCGVEQDRTNGHPVFFVHTNLGLLIYDNDEVAVVESDSTGGFRVSNSDERFNVRDFNVVQQHVEAFIESLHREEDDG